MDGIDVMVAQTLLSEVGLDMSRCGRSIVRAIQPSRHWKTLVWCRALGLGCSISAAASSLVATTPISFETEQALRLYGVNHGSI